MLNELKHNQKLIELFREYGITEASLFGSQLNGKAKKNSDIDLLIDYDVKDPRMGFPGPIYLEKKLRKLLGKKVDVCDKMYIIPELKEEICSTAKLFYKAG